MRVATISIFNNGSASLQKHIADQARLQNQLSTGRKILTPADDPIASARILDIGQARSINEQYATNSGAAESFMRLSESTLQQVTSLIHNVQELAVSAGNPVLGPEEKKMKAADLLGRYQELLALANTTDGQGNYLFSGFQGETKPFGELSFGNVQYYGDDGQRVVQISDGRQIPISESGADVFQQIKNGNGSFVTAYNPSNVGTGIVSPGEVLEPKKWANAPAPRDFTVQFYWQPNASKPEEPIISYDLIDSSGVSLISGAATAGQTSGPRSYSSGSDIEFKRLPTDPAGPAWDYGVKTSVMGKPIPFDPLTQQPVGAPGAADSFSLKPSTNVDLFTTLGNLHTALSNYHVDAVGNGQAEFQNQLNTALSDLSGALINVTTTQAYLGSRMNETDSVKETTEDLKIQYSQTLGDLQNLDYAAAISDFAANQMVLDAARKSFAQVQELSLFRYI
ncbi:flagellar hook-associated protein FlgL [Chitinibacter sp. S2-10]|uniref:flagellar hook-associated protein FlgL n=1 Tax=Chitinibacter sp. S2-10 TaxID=3373597 RepID=UPI0039777D33